MKPAMNHLEGLRRLGRATAAVCLAGIVFAAMPAKADSPQTAITVGADFAKVVNVAGEPATVIVGNPLFADATIQRGKVIIQGKHFGTTNVLVLNRNGSQLANLEVSVMRSGKQNVVVYKAAKTWSYVCAPNCEHTLVVGDNEGYFNDRMQKQIDSKTNASTSAANVGSE